MSFNPFNKYLFFRMSSERINEMSGSLAKGFSDIGLPATHIADIGYTTDVDKGRSTGMSQTMEYRGQNFNFQFASGVGQTGTVVQDVSSVVQEPGLFEQSGQFEGQLFPSHADDKNGEFQFTTQQFVPEFTPGQGLEFIERSSGGVKRAHLKAVDSGQHQTSNVIIYMPSDVQICGQSYTSAAVNGDTFARQGFCRDTTQIVNLVGNLTDIKSTAICEISNQRTSPEKIKDASGTLSEHETVKVGTATMEEVSTMSTEDFLRENTTPEAQETAKDELKFLKAPPNLRSLTSFPRLNPVLRQRLKKDANSRHEKTLTSALSTLFFDERSSLYQQELVELLKPLVRMLELLEASPIDAESMRRMLGSVVALVASLQEIIVADRRKSVMIHYGVEDSLQCKEEQDIELFGKDFLLGNGFTQRKCTTKDAKKDSKRKSPIPQDSPLQAAVSPVKRKYKENAVMKKSNVQSDSGKR